ncbi:MAG: thioesterase [Cryomorphaceae bacterium BACL21 MAG-121220-bin10]|jgi:acyl-CoA thioester hydrolase|nr:MAG: thioesterase [Cryomorphaceae bacterium BACL21 MAG-121220-bin10]|tara:strand:- start:2531 stop:2941 length:411 start_codon:yes stop_codon:yes gene_type:complete
MKKTKTELRVRYGETDQMGFVYYGHYALYLEQGRTDWLRHLGFSYKFLEQENILLPVTKLVVNYHAPARYDDFLIIHTDLKNFPTAKIEFGYEIYNQENTLLVTADTTLVFVDKLSGKVRKAPDYLIDKLAEESEV